MRFPYPSREPTPSEYAVLVVFIAVVFIIVRVVALAMGLRAPAEKHEVAVALEHRGFWSLGDWRSHRGCLLAVSPIEDY